jgi:hypothetical protein
MYDWAELYQFKFLPAILKRQGTGVAAEELHTSRPKLIVGVRQLPTNPSVQLFRKDQERSYPACRNQDCVDDCGPVALGRDLAGACEPVSQAPRRRKKWV